MVQMELDLYINSNYSNFICNGMTLIQFNQPINLIYSYYYYYKKAYLIMEIYFSWLSTQINQSLIISWNKLAFTIIAALSALILSYFDYYSDRTTHLFEFQESDLFGLKEIRLFPLSYWLLLIDFFCFIFIQVTIAIHIDLFVVDFFILI